MLKKSLVLNHIDHLIKVMNQIKWEDKKIYGYWLAQTYYLVRHTTAFLALSAAKSSQREEQYQSLKHLIEELNHDKMLLKDLDSLGFKITNFPELHEVSALYQSQYYFIDREGPSSHLGYSMLLEGLAGNPQTNIIYNRIKETHGKAAISFLKLHSEVDKNHFETHFPDTSTLDIKTQKAILNNLSQSAYFYELILKKIKEY